MRRSFLILSSIVVLLARIEAQGASPVFHQVEVTVQGQEGIRSIPPGAQRVEMLSVTFFNNDADTPAVLHSLTLTHRGLGRSADIDRVYAVLSGERMTDGVSINAADRRVTLRFVPSLSISEGGNVTIMVFVDMASTAQIAAEHRLVLTDPTDVDADRKSVVFKNVDNPDAPARTVGSTRGMIVVEYLTLPRPPRYGRRQLVARIRLTADSSDDHRIYSVTLTNDGKARGSDLQNMLILSNRGTMLSGILPQLEGVRKNRAWMIFSPPLLLGKNSDVVLNVFADVRASRRRTIRLIVEEPGDISAVPKRGRD